MARFYSVARDSFGNALSSPTITVYLAGTSTLATIYTDDALSTAKANPFTGGADGAYHFYAGPGEYKVKATKEGFSDFEVDNVEIPGKSSVFDVRTYGATGDGTTDDTAAIARAIAAAEAATSTGTVYFPSGTFKVIGSGSVIFTLTKALEIRGNGFGTRIMPASTVPNTRDVFLFDPVDSNVSGRMARFFNFRIRGEAAGVARYGIHIKPTGTNQFAHNVDIDRIWTQDISSFGVFVDGSDADALGVLALLVRRCEFIGDGLGGASMWDSCEVDHCLFAGTGWAIDATWVSGAGKFNVHDCNITSTKGVRVGGGIYSPAFTDNYFELGGAATYGGANAAYLDLEGSVADPIQGAIVRGNILHVFGTAGTTAGVRVNRAHNSLITGNHFSGPAGGTSIVTTANALNTHVAADNVYVGAGPRFSNAGSMTSGGNKLLGALQSDGSTVSNTTNETAYNKSFTIPANYLKAGQVLRVRAAGRFSCTGTPVLNNRIKIGITVGPPVSGGQLIGTNGFTCTSGVTDFTWGIECELVVRSVGTAGSFSRSTSPLTQTSIGAAITVDTTAAIVIHPTAQWSAADPANTVTLTQFSVELREPVASI